jgi:RNA polymerase sigma-70 factor (ECF subfamily)
MADDPFCDLGRDHADPIAAASARARIAYPDLPAEAFAEAIVLSVRAWAAKLDTPPALREIRDYIETLHAEDLALACLCRAGDARAWEKLVTDYRSALYAAARAITRDEGSSRELADELYADLYGLAERDGRRRSLLDYFHGRSSLKTWLRAVLAQRFVDLNRGFARVERIEAAHETIAATTPDVSDPDDASRAHYLEAFARAFSAAVAQLTGRDRLRLNLYYAQELTLKEIGRLMNEYESSVSRRLLKSRKQLRRSVEESLRRENDLDEEQIRLCYAWAMQAWSADLGRLFAET